MDKLYLDANVILDYLQKRSGAEYVEKLFVRAHSKNLSLCTSVLNFATIFYLERRRGHSTNKILDRFHLINRIISPIDQTTESYFSALKSNFSDFEDALQYFAAKEVNVDFLITNNKKDFKRSKIPVLTAREFVARGA